MTRKLPKSKYKTTEPAGVERGPTMQNKLDWTTTRAGMCERGMEMEMEWWDERVMGGGFESIRVNVGNDNDARERFDLG